MFQHIRKNLIKNPQVTRSFEQQQRKKEAADIYAYIENLVGADAIERISTNGDTLVVKCSSPSAAHRARMHVQTIKENTKTKRVFFLS